MADLIKVKSGALGTRTTMPYLNEDELGFRTDEGALYIGTNDGNVRLCGAGDIARLEWLIADINTRLGALEKPSQ